MTRITGQQARDLLRGTTPGPWEPVGADIDSPEGQIGGAWDGEVGRLANAELMAAAPDLAETVAWLYGREPDRVGGWTDLRYGLGDGFRVDLRGDRVSVGTVRLSMHFSRDEAVDLARALLAAAEEACDVQ